MESASYVEKVKEIIENFTECAICRDTFEDARMLPCIHTFCLKCLKDYGKDKSPGDELSCPMCKKAFKIPQGGFEEIQIHSFVNKLIDVCKYPDEGKQEAKESNEVFCDHCMVDDSKVIAAGYCVDCSDHLCTICLKRHKVLKSTARHRVYTMDKKPPVDELIKMTENNYCSQHEDQKIHAYCFDCKTTACYVCLMTEPHNREHRCLDIKKSAAEFEQATNKDSAVVNDFMKETEEIINRIDSVVENFSENVQVVESAITKKYEDTKVFLDEHYSDLVKRLKELRTKRIKDLLTMKDECEQELMAFESFQRNWNEVKTRGSPCDIVQTASTLQKRVSELKVQHEQQHGERKGKSKSMYEIEFNPANSVSVNGQENMLGSLEEIVFPTMMYPKCPDFTQLLIERKAQNLNLNGTQITGIAIHDKEMFLVRQQCQYVVVSNLQNPAAATRNINVSGMTNPVGLVYSEADSLLYAINEQNNSYMHKINPRDNSVRSTGWVLQAGQPRGLSVSKKNNLLVSYSSVGRIDEFDGSGQLIRSITLSDDIRAIYHTIELRTGNLIINQYNPLHRICLADSSGKIIQSYGNNYGSGVGQLCHPSYTDVDQRGNTLVADCDNNKLRIFDSNLKHLGDVNTGGTQINYPWCMCWDKENDRLLVSSGGNLWSISKI